MILTIGTSLALARSMTFGRLILDTVNRAASVEQYAAGKSVNVARVLHALGQETIATGTVGGDTGRILRSDLDRAGIGHDFVDVAAPTRVCITVIDSATSQATELVEETGPVTLDELQRLRAKLTELIPRAKLIVMSGTLAPGISDDFYGWCCQTASKHAARSIVDARGKPLLNCLSHHPAVVKPNRQELSETVGFAIDSDDDLRSAIRQITSITGGWVVVTDGPRQVVVSDGRGFRTIAPPRVQVVSAIGSGDALCAGIAAGLIQHMSVPDAARLGVACGAANAMTSAAGHVRPADVQSILTSLPASAEA